MNELNKFTKEAFGAEFSGEFSTYASYERSMDYVEYLQSSEIVVSRRIDEYLTLILNQSRTEVVGFRLKGYKHLFNEKLKTLMDLDDSDFVHLVAVFEAMILEQGPDFVKDQNKRDAYSSAYKMAKQSNAKITDVPLAA